MENLGLALIFQSVTNTEVMRMEGLGNSFFCFFWFSETQTFGGMQVGALDQIRNRRLYQKLLICLRFLLVQLRI